MRYRFRPQLIPTLAFLILLPTLIHLGMWQYDKAARKQELQALLDKRGEEAAIPLTTRIDDAEQFRYRRIRVTGQWEPAYQILLDNQVNSQEQVGYHVLTPLRIAGGTLRILVDRGWVPVGPDRRRLPEVMPPGGEVTVDGIAVPPPTKFFTLGKVQDSHERLEPVWQNLDLQRYRQSVPFPLQPVVLQMDPHSPAGGYQREWTRPDERMEKHLSYAYQWFGMAATLVGIFIYVNLKKVEAD